MNFRFPNSDFPSSARSPRRAAQLRSSRLCAALLFLLLSFVTAHAAQMRFGPYTNFDGMLITNFDLIYQAVGDPAIDAAGNVAGAIGLPKRIHLGTDGMLTNTVQNQNIHVLNAPPTPYFFTANGYMFRAPLDSGPTIYSTTQPGVFITGMNYFVTLVMSNGTVSSITYNVITNALGYAPAPFTVTNGLIAKVDATNISSYISGVYSNSLYTDYTTKLAQLTALSLTNAFATNTAGVTTANGRIYVSTNYDILGTALAMGVTQSNLTIAASNTLYTLIGSGISAVTATNITTNQVFKGTNTIGFASGLSAFAPTNQFDPAGTALAIGLQSTNFSLAIGLAATNYTLTASNHLYALIGAAGISATTATNISTNQVFLGTNNIGIASGLSAFRPTNSFDASGVGLAAATAATNGIGISSGLAGLVSTNRFEISGAAAIKANTNKPTVWNGTFFGGTNYGNTLWPNATTPLASTMINSNQINAHSVAADSIGANTTNYLTLGSSMRFDFDDGELDDFSGNTIIDHSGNYHGGLTLASNLPAAGISTNGSAANQVLASIGGRYTPTNVTAILGTSYTNGFVDKSITNNAATIALLTTTSNLLQGLISVSGMTIPQFLSSLAANTNIYSGVFTNSKATITHNGDGFLADSTINWDTSGNFTAIKFIGSGRGLNNLTVPPTAGVTNVILERSDGSLTTNDVLNIASGGAIPMIGVTSNFLYATKMDKTNSTSYGQTATNIVLEGNLGFGSTGQATNIYGSSPTNFILFIGAGESSVTNGPFIWVSALNVYSNHISGAWMTNNGSAELVKSNTVTLYSLAGANPIGTYSAISGVTPAPTAVATAQIRADRFAWDGFLSPANLNAMSNAIIAASSGGGGGGISMASGLGTNTSIYGFTSTNISVPSPGNFILGSADSGNQNNASANTNDAIIGGTGNIISGSTRATNNIILGGANNAISNSVCISTIAGGFGNKIYGQFSVGDSFIAGGSSTITWDGTSPAGSTNYSNFQDANISLGYGNLINGKRSTAIGNYNIITNYGSLSVNDGVPGGPNTNYQAYFHFASGYKFTGGGADFTAVTVGGTPLISQASLIPFTNSSAAGILSTNLGDGANTNIVYSDINGGMHSGAIGSGLAWNATTKTLSASGGGGTQTPIAQDVDYAGNAATNMSALKVTNTASIGGQVTMNALILTNGFTNIAWTASTLLEADANKKAISLANASGFLTNNGSGGIGYLPLTSVALTNQLLDATALGANSHVKTGSTTNLISSEDATGYTNAVWMTNYLATTNIPISFNTPASQCQGIITNGPDVFITFGGGDRGSWSLLIETNVTLHLPAQIKWLSGSNNVITNGVLSFTVYGGTNRVKAAMKENQ